MKSKFLIFACTIWLFLSVNGCGVNRYYIVRHADRFEYADSLTESGFVRAEILKDSLRHKHINIIYSTDTRRTRLTAKPVSDLFHLPVILYTSDTMELFVNQLKNLPGKNVLIVGHSNTVDDITNLLYGEAVVPADLNFTEYDNLFYVQRRRGNHPRSVFKNYIYGPVTE